MGAEERNRRLPPPDPVLRRAIDSALNKDASDGFLHALALELHERLERLAELEASDRKAIGNEAGNTVAVGREKRLDT